MRKHRWSGWPGAYCLDCGCGDPFEMALADGNIVWDSTEIAPEHRDNYPSDECGGPFSDRPNDIPTKPALAKTLKTR